MIKVRPRSRVTGEHLQEFVNLPLLGEARQFSKSTLYYDLAKVSNLC